MFANRFCGVVALIVTCLAGCAYIIATVLLTNPEVQALFAKVFRPEINLVGWVIFVLYVLAELGLLLAISLLALAHLIPQEMSPPSCPALNNNRCVDQDQLIITGSKVEAMEGLLP